MSKVPSIAAVTVAFNGEHLLARHLNALLGQTRPVEEIVVVNNGSRDKTSQFLQSHFPMVKVIDLPTNTGMGGGLSAGLSYAALHQRHDWVWMLDQDSIPEAQSLERLLGGMPAGGTSEQPIAMLAPLCMNSELEISYPGMLWQNGWRPSPPQDAHCRTWFVDATITSGSLIRREAVEKAGLPRDDFFIDFVDLEYCLRLRHLGYKIVMVRDSTLEHTIGSPRKIKILGHSAIWTDHAPWRHYYMARNEVFTIWSYYPGWGPKYSVVHRLFERAVRLLLYGTQKLNCLKMMCLGVMDGRKGRLGIRFLENAG
jgi:GT2 family glycosyltransferase